VLKRGWKPILYDIFSSFSLLEGFGEPSSGFWRGKHCENEVNEGIGHLKYHLVRILRHEVDLCTSVSVDLQQQAHETIQKSIYKEGKKRCYVA
jgi:hypothetical protein